MNVKSQQKSSGLRLSVRVEPSEVRQLRDLASQHGVTLSAIVREAIDGYWSLDFDAQATGGESVGSSAQPRARKSA